MACTGMITMSMRELDRFKVIQDVADGRLKPWRTSGAQFSTISVDNLVDKIRSPARSSCRATLARCLIAG
ncbi:hypothetical protein [Paraburkholderia adhaesiva]|uniref:hypothetical protein n=1 Tax=Paraburkholderia adhaesiva TaxID=2883244 RepID=UPI001F2AC843|nr:hypothetical protein [Paraburkholderia adhaesiva]